MTVSVILIMLYEFAAFTELEMKNDFLKSEIEIVNTDLAQCCLPTSSFKLSLDFNP